MRKRFEQQLSLGVVPISEVNIWEKSRHQLPPLLIGLKYIFLTPELNEAIFEILEKKIIGSKKATGRPGMSLWEILVFGVVRLNLNLDYDHLHDLSNYHRGLRGILGVDSTKDFTEQHYYHLQTLKDNVGLLDGELLEQINELVVKAGHNLIKKKTETLGLEVKVDSYAVESNVHFPTDINLLWDSARKCLDVMEHLLDKVGLTGWRKLKEWSRKIRNHYRKSSEIHRRKGKDYQVRLEQAIKQYLGICIQLREKLRQSEADLLVACALNPMLIGLWEELKYYQQMLDKHINLVDRRIVKGERIPHEEKVFSIFEPYTEWLQKGKKNRTVELGLNTLIATCQHGFILVHQVMVKQKDVHLSVEVARCISQTYEQGYEMSSISYDRNFYSAPNKKSVGKIFAEVIMPKKGKKTAKQEQAEQEENFVRLRKQHSAVESNINELEHHGVNRCPDRGIRSFKRYVALGVLSYNLKKLGKLLIEQQKMELAKKPNQRA